MSQKSPRRPVVGDELKDLLKAGSEVDFVGAETWYNYHHAADGTCSGSLRAWNMADDFDESGSYQHRRGYSMARYESIQGTWAVHDDIYSFASTVGLVEAWNFKVTVQDGHLEFIPIEPAIDPGRRFHTVRIR